MGVEQHNVIIVTSWNQEVIEEARDKAVEFRLLVTNIVTAKLNGYLTFVVTPCGSKAGWTEDIVDRGRKQNFLDWTETTKHEDGSGPLRVAYITYGERGTYILSSTCEAKMNSVP